MVVSKKNGQRDLICQDYDSCGKDFNCVVGELTRIYRKAGFRDFIITGSKIKEKFIKLVDKYNSLKQITTLNWGKSNLVVTKKMSF